MADTDSYIFLTADVIALIVQAVGGSVASQGAAVESLAQANHGANIMLGGILVQFGRRSCHPQAISSRSESYIQLQSSSTSLSPWSILFASRWTSPSEPSLRSHGLIVSTIV